MGNEYIDQPYIQFTLGSATEGYTDQLVPFKNQYKIESGELDTINKIRIRIVEYNLDIVNGFPPDSGLFFKVDINTSKDKQDCLTGYNCGLIGFAYSVQSSKVSQVSCVFEFPIKISDNAIPDNDTLEFNDGDDYIVISYTSIYSRLSARDSVLIKKF